jgi:hypothetical protein
MSILYALHDLTTSLWNNFIFYDYVQLDDHLNASPAAIAEIGSFRSQTLHRVRRSRPESLETDSRQRNTHRHHRRKRKYPPTDRGAVCKILEPFIGDPFPSKIMVSLPVLNRITRCWLILPCISRVCPVKQTII